jgi:hypothetical protein
MDFSCKAQLVGIGQFTRCLEDAPSKCSYAVPVGSAYFCESPLRVYSAKIGENSSNKKGGEKLLNVERV